MGLSASAIDAGLARVAGAVRTVAGSGSPVKGSFWAPTVTIGAVAAAASIGPSLFPRDTKMQAGISVASAIVGLGAGALAEGVARGLGHVTPGGRMGAYAAIAGAGLLAVGATKLTGMDRHSSVAAGVGTGGVVFAAAAAAGLAATAIARHVPAHAGLAQLALPAVAGGAVLTRSLLDRRAEHGRNYQLPLPALPAVHEAGLARLDWGGRTRRDLMPGVDPATVQYDKLPPNGRRYLWERVTKEEITRVMGKPAIAEPRRLYVGLDEAPAGLSQPQLVEWVTDTALKRMVAGGAFERGHILVGSSTSTGFLNPQAAMSQELMTLGDNASIVVQAGHKKAIFELGHLQRASQIHERLLQKIAAHIAKMPEGKRPEVDIYGESYGAWASQNAFAGTGLGDMDKYGVAHAMYTGSPAGSTWRREVLDNARLSAGAQPTVRLVRSAVDDLKVSDAQVAHTRVTFLTHDADPVANFMVSDLWKRPEWLPTSGARGEGISTHQRWWPVVSGIQLAVDQQRAQYFTKGTLEAKGHDYRAELPLEWRRAYGHTDVTDAQVARVREYGRQAELRWVDHNPEAHA